MSDKVYFVGAGPGDPDLITVKGLKILQKADIIVYAGSLVNKEILKKAQQTAKIFNSAKMHLDEIARVMIDGFRSGKTVLRLQTGDTSLYGALAEQVERLNEQNIPYEVVPGVSSAFASIAALGGELTLPEITQTVIFTRIEGRTPVPDSERLASLARHHATICIFLSIKMIGKVVDELLSEYHPGTPVAVVYKASWPDQVTICGTLDNISEKVTEANITKTAMIIVGDVLSEEIKKGNTPSRLYCKEFGHDYRGKS
ncbi:MAG: precorrin-4 C(11)-methyltransferase [Nitrospinota bacterium]